MPNTTLIGQITLLAQKCAQEDFANSAAAAAALAAAQAAQADATQALNLGGAAYKYKGTVATIADLPAADNEVGDVYNVGSTLDGGNYAWNGTAWDSIGQAFTTAVALTSTSGTGLVPEGLAVTALALKQDSAEIGDTTNDFVADYTTAYTAAQTAASSSGNG